MCYTCSVLYNLIFHALLLLNCCLIIHHERARLFFFIQFSLELHGICMYFSTDASSCNCTDEGLTFSWIQLCMQTVTEWKHGTCPERTLKVAHRLCIKTEPAGSHFTHLIPCYTCGNRKALVRCTYKETQLTPGTFRWLSWANELWIGFGYSISRW